jgi:hypothetical protein
MHSILCHAGAAHLIGFPRSVNPSFHRRHGVIIPDRQSEWHDATDT